MNDATTLALIPLLPLAGFVLNGLWGRKMTRTASGLIGCAGPALAFALSVLAFVRCSDSLTPLTANYWTWMAAGTLKIDVAFSVDALTAVMLLVVTGVGTLIHVYSVEYMKGDAGFSRYFAYLNLFMFSMLVLVLADNLLVMFVGWEGVGLCSYLLIGFWFPELKNADAGRKAFVVNRVGDFGFLLGILYLLAVVGTVSFPELNSRLPGTATALLMAPALLLFLGACGKSAQIPLHVWLPDAMAGPTPVSALIHAATMVTAGVYMIARLGFLYAWVDGVGDLIGVVAGATALMAAITACSQTDIKKILAWSTISQLGFMFAGMAAEQYHAGMFHVVTHAFFKALLFLGAGAVIHALHGEQDIRKMGGLGKKLPALFLVFAAGAAALAGLPLLSGFFSKDAILAAVYERAADSGIMWSVWIVLLATAGLTAFYSARLLAVVFLGSPHKEEEGHEIHMPGALMMTPLFILAVLAVFGGGLQGPVNSFLARDLGPLRAGPAHDHAHHLNMILSIVISLAGAGLGLAMYTVRRKWLDALQRLEPVRLIRRLSENKFYFDEIYRWTIVAGVKTAAAGLWFVVDRLLIDRLFVGGPAWVAYRASRSLKRIHTGVISVSGGAMAAGAVVILGYLVFRLMNHG